MKLSSLGAGIAAVAATLLAIASPAHASVATFDFENQNIGTETPFSLTNNGVTATFASTGDDPSGFGGAFGIVANFGSTYKRMSGDFLSVGSARISNDPLTITFSQAITSFSFDFALDDPGSTTTTLAFTTDAGGSGAQSGSLDPNFRYPEGLLSFSGSPFTSITFSSAAFDFQMDNLQVTTAAAAAVPEPASLLLLGACVPAFALSRRRNRSTGRNANALNA